MPRLSRLKAAVCRIVTLPALVVLLSSLAVSVYASIGCFRPGFKTIPTFNVTPNSNATPSYIISGDFNNDGRLDVVVSTDSTTNGTWIRLGNGGGGFGPSRQIGPSGTYLLALDVGNNGTLDVVLVKDSGPTAYYLLTNDGAANFSQSPLFFDGGPQTVVAADINGDGYLDLAGVSNSQNWISVLFYSPISGGYGGSTNYSVGPQPRGLAVGDFNNDGRPDLVTTSTINDGVIQVLLNTGSTNYTGNFFPPINTDRFGTALFISVADFNSDGKADVALALNNSTTISIRLGNGAGGFNAFNGTNDYQIISQPANLTIADFNSDGKLDIATANRTQSSEVSLLTGDGAGNFAPPKHFTTGYGPWSTALGDFNSDGKLDLAVAFRNTTGTANNNTFGLLLGDGAGNFPAITKAYPVGSNPLAVAIADFNGDSKNDLLTMNQNSNDLSLLLGNGLGDFGAATTIGGFSSPRAFVVADFNNDLKPDIAVANGGSSSVSVLLNNGAGVFTPAPGSPYIVAGDPRAIAVGDLNSDTKLDIVTGAFNGDRISVLFNLGAGGFGNYAEYQLSATIYLRVTDLVIGDFNQDNLPDVAAKSYDSAPGSGNANRITLFFNQGGGALGNRTDRNANGLTLVGGDFNRDGKLDMATETGVYLNAGGGTFTAIGVNLPFATNDLATADVNGDGKLDLIATANVNNSQVFITTGNGFGGFGVATASYLVSQIPYGIAVGDLNDDTRPDLAITNASLTNGSVQRLLNVCNKTPADFDDDGRTDISVWNSANGNWTIVNSRDSSIRTQVDWGRQSLGDVPVPGDYDGDAKADIAIFRQSEGNWYVINSDFSSVRVQNWGGPNDRPAPADYDGDGKTDFAVFRPSEGNWYILLSETGTTKVQGWGVSTDKLVPGDYDADGKADIAVWRPVEGNWYVIKSTGGVIQQQWGIFGDIPIQGDYDGDSKTDIAVWRPSEGNWYIVNSSTNAISIRNWGDSNDVPVPGDYDRDGKTDIAVYRPSEGTWYIIQSSTNTSTLRSLGGGPNLVPIPATYIPYQ
jgi:hypothetical protein